MPSEVSKYIQDFIRPRKPFTDEIDVIYDYFLHLEHTMYERFYFKIGMKFTIKDKVYEIIKTNKKYSILKSTKRLRRYQNSKLNIRQIENKTIFIKRYIRTMNMVQLIMSYLCYGEDAFHKMIILKKYKKFWTSYI